MKRILLTLGFLTLSVSAHAQTASNLPDVLTDPTPFVAVSNDLRENLPTPNMHIGNSNGCDGKNLSPIISWSYPPDGTKSYAVTMFDLDARDGDGWLHWAVFSIPAKEKLLARGAGIDQPLPEGATILPNSYGNAGYDGPCPPLDGKIHRYEFTVYAMPDETVVYPLNAVGWPTIEWLADHALATSSFKTTYQRPAE